METLEEINGIIHGNRGNFREGYYLLLQNKLKELFDKIENKTEECHLQ